ncbi:MAG: aminocarboxymuconate-semialdehyde decarboxylase [Frankiaceae bacterium]|nr:aminocarboxymuconate-semialdehyde decarboxylase [Frankiaceae bacterium]
MIIDVHGHLSPPSSARRFPMPPSLTDPEAMVAEKAANGIDLTLIGSPVGGGAMLRVPGVDNYAQTRDQLRAFHDELAEMISRFPHALRGMVYVDPLGGDDLLEGAAETLADDAFVGLIVNSSIAGRYLDTPQADSFFALAAERDLPVLVHPPAEPLGSQATADFRLVEHLARVNDVTAGIAAVIFGGWLEKYPTLKLIAPGAGGALSLLAEKLDLAARTPVRGGPPGGAPRTVSLTEPPSRQLRRIYVDTATPSALAVRSAVELFGADHVLFGTDSPPLPNVVGPSVRLVEELPVGDEARQQIFCDNAQGLFRLGVPARV